MTPAKSPVDEQTAHPVDESSHAEWSLEIFGLLKTGTFVDILKPKMWLIPVIREQSADKYFTKTEKCYERTPKGIKRDVERVIETVYPHDK